jgi:hypothetical protein
LGDVDTDITNKVEMKFRERACESVDWINTIKKPKLHENIKE